LSAVRLSLLPLLFPAPTMGEQRPVQPAETAGYLLVPHGKVKETYNAGFSMCVAAWPLLTHYPGQEFQSGLFGTWMFAQLDGPAPKNHYSDTEGVLAGGLPGRPGGAVSRGRRTPRPAGRRRRRKA
jgi:hypothetical protein